MKNVTTSIGKYIGLASEVASEGASQLIKTITGGQVF